MKDNQKCEVCYWCEQVTVKNNTPWPDRWYVCRFSDRNFEMTDNQGNCENHTTNINAKEEK